MSIEFPKQPANQNEPKIELPEELSGAMRGLDDPSEPREARQEKLAKLARRAEKFLSASENEDDFDNRFEAIKAELQTWGFEYESLGYITREMLLSMVKQRFFPPKKK